MCPPIDILSQSFLIRVRYPHPHSPAARPAPSDFLNQPPLPIPLYARAPLSWSLPLARSHQTCLCPPRPSPCSVLSATARLHPPRLRSFRGCLPSPGRLPRARGSRCCRRCQRWRCRLRRCQRRRGRCRGCYRLRHGLFGLRLW